MLPWTASELIVILVTMTTVPLAEAKSHFSELVARVGSQHERVTVTVHGKPTAVLLATADLEALEETLAILSDPDAVQSIREGREDIAAGRVESADDVAAAMRKRGMNV